MPWNLLVVACGVAVVLLAAFAVLVLLGGLATLYKAKSRLLEAQHELLMVQIEQERAKELAAQTTAALWRTMMTSSVSERN